MHGDFYTKLTWKKKKRITSFVHDAFQLLQSYLIRGSQVTGQPRGADPPAKTDKQTNKQINKQLNKQANKQKQTHKQIKKYVNVHVRTVQ